MKQRKPTILDIVDREYRTEERRNPSLLYHRDAYGFPKNVRIPSGTFALTLSQHALQEARTDRYGAITLGLMPQVNIREQDIFEIEVTRGVVTKITVRIPYDARRDIIFALIPQTNVVKTIWSNLKTDIHKTLQKNKYARP